MFPMTEDIETTNKPIHIGVQTPKTVQISTARRLAPQVR